MIGTAGDLQRGDGNFYASVAHPYQTPVRPNERTGISLVPPPLFVIY